MTKSEVVLWKFIKGNQLDFKFRRQYGIGNYIVDFYCPKIKLAIEIDGSTHIEEEVFKRDQRKEKYIKFLGINLIRFNGDRIFNDLENVLQDLSQTCKNLSSSNHPFYKGVNKIESSPYKGEGREGSVQIDLPLPPPC